MAAARAHVCEEVVEGEEAGGEVSDLNNPKDALCDVALSSALYLSHRAACDASDYIAHVHGLALRYGLEFDEADRRFRAFVVSVPFSWREVGDPGPRVMQSEAV